MESTVVTPLDGWDPILQLRNVECSKRSSVATLEAMDNQNTAEASSSRDIGGC